MNQKSEKCAVITSRVSHSPKTKTNPVLNKNRSQVSSHYDAWNGQGLDEVLLTQKKRGLMYEMHIKQQKKRHEKQKLKEMQANGEILPTEI